MQRDIVLRWVAQIALVVRRLLYGPGPRDLELAAGHVEAALEQHLGSVALLVPRLDSESAAQLLHDPDRIFGYAQLLSLSATIAHARGTPDAPALQIRAVAVAREALSRSQPAPAEWTSWLAEAEAWLDTPAPPGPPG